MNRPVEWAVDPPAGRAASVEHSLRDTGDLAFIPEDDDHRNVDRLADEELGGLEEYYRVAARDYAEALAVGIDGAARRSSVCEDDLCCAARVVPERARDSGGDRDARERRHNGIADHRASRSGKREDGEDEGEQEAKSTIHGAPLLSFCEISGSILIIHLNSQKVNSHEKHR